MYIECYYIFSLVMFLPFTWNLNIIFGAHIWTCTILREEQTISYICRTQKKIPNLMNP